MPVATQKNRNLETPGGGDADGGTSSCAVRAAEFVHNKDFKAGMAAGDAVHTL